ncbi:glycosyl transferase family 1 [Motilibacter rhizosphaerae]|uniref:Glycosyl transferase family 1 n=1 Tax=Motilibacter rhizosphaerae TaxID=598652 RepID=A0A4Q7NQ99_9ACTN|nr:glycosyl transferase family 1 [Motilibacter rhizosphaerae]
MQGAVGVACSQDPSDPSSFSGTPSGILAGLRALGVDGRPVAATLPTRSQQGLEAALAALALRPAQLGRPLRDAYRENQSRLVASRPLEAARNLLAARAARRSGAGAFIQFGTDFRLPAGSAYVTYDDQTVVQALRSGQYPWARALSAEERVRVVERQRQVFAGAIACCVGSEWAARSVCADYGIPTDRVRVVGFGARDLQAPVGERDWSRPRFLFVGRDWTRKNGDRVMRAFAELRRRVPAATLDLVGEHPPVEAPGVTGHGVLALGDPADQTVLAALYARATCLVVPSLHEPAGIVYVEAAAAGVGSIGTTSGGAADLVGEGGRVVDPEDDAALLTAMTRFADPATARAFGERAHAGAASSTWTAVAGRLLAALGGVTAAAPPAAASQTDTTGT